MISGGFEGANVLQMLQVKADLFQNLPPDGVLRPLSSGYTAAGKGPLLAPIRVTNQENGAAVLNHALDAERVRPHEKPVELENPIDELDERPLRHGPSTMS